MQTSKKSGFQINEIDDAPALTAEMLENAEIFDGDKFIRKGPGRPIKSSPKEAVNIRLDQDIVAKLRESGPGWQSKINQILRDYCQYM